VVKNFGERRRDSEGLAPLKPGKGTRSHTLRPWEGEPELRGRVSGRPAFYIFLDRDGRPRQVGP